ncbi:MAG: single-stranded DNA-binding protein [Mangrovibacterium sp.]
MAINKVILIGNVGQDPEVKYLEQDVAVANFSLATTERYTSREGQRMENTEWHRIVVWRGLAKVVEQYVKKGSKLYIEGRLRTREWTDKDGNKRYTTEIYADNLEMLDGRSASTYQDQAAPSANPAGAPSPQPDLSRDADDDLPF